ncbi:MAG: hypothetical protein LBK25_09120 [Treponema sp.]|jgi:hypothetical protein|nr:hypothetical protein [Treponema sp.]
MRVYDQYEKTERDWVSSMNGAERKGIAEGRAEGIIEGRAEERSEIMALLEQGVSLEELKARYGV